MIKNGDKPIRNPWIVLREEFDDWAVLFDPDTGHGFGLSPIGVYVWKLIDGGHSIDTLVERVCAHAEGVPEDVGDHMRTFIDALVAEGLAGLDSTGRGLSNNPDKAKLYPEKCFYAPPGAESEVKPFTYAPPGLVDFRGGQTAQGTCSPVGAACSCTPGSTANGGNCGPGGTAQNWCGPGSSAGSVCSSNGSSAASCSGFGSLK